MKFRNYLVIAGAMYFATSLPIAMGFLTGVRISGGFSDTPVSWQKAIQNGDVSHYTGIVDKGYVYNQRARSNVAFFPVFPLLAHGLKITTGMSSVLALLLISNMSFLAATCLSIRYFHLRQTCYPNTNHVTMLGPLALLTAPCSFFFVYRTQNRFSWSYSLHSLLESRGNGPLFL